MLGLVVTGVDGDEEGMGGQLPGVDDDVEVRRSLWLITLLNEMKFWGLIYGVILILD